MTDVCRTCYYCHLNGCIRDEEIYGEFRRYPPIISHFSDKSIEKRYFPVVYLETDWCGEWRKK